MADAAHKIDLEAKPYATKAQQTLQKRFIKALSLDDGYGWDSNLRKAGFVVLQAV